MVIGFIICAMMSAAFGILAYKSYLNYCEKKADERCQQFKRK